MCCSQRSPRSRDRSVSPPPRRRRASPSPEPSRNYRRGPNSPEIEAPRVNDVDPVRRRQRQAAMLSAQIDSELAGKNGESANGADRNANDSAAVARKGDGGDLNAKAEFAKLLGSRSGGAYIPPAKLRAMQAEAAKDKMSAEYQRLSWDALRKSINGLINKVSPAYWNFPLSILNRSQVNISNIKHVIPELFGENLIRGKGLFARSIMRAQAASLPFTPIFAALVAIINTKLPQVGELVLVRLISQFRRAYKRNDKVRCSVLSNLRIR